MADLRFNCTENYKKQIKKEAINRGISVSQLLSEVVLAAMPANGEFIAFEAKTKKEGENDDRNY